MFWTVIIFQYIYIIFITVADTSFVKIQYNNNKHQ